MLGDRRIIYGRAFVSCTVWQTPTGAAATGILLTYQEATAGVQLQVALQVVHVETTSRILGDLNNVRAALPPRKDVGVVLERPDEHHWPAFMYVCMNTHRAMQHDIANAARYRFGSHALQMHGAMHVDTCMLRSERPLKPCTAPCTLRNTCIRLDDRQTPPHSRVGGPAEAGLLPIELERGHEFRYRRRRA